MCFRLLECSLWFNYVRYQRTFMRAQCEALRDSGAYMVNPFIDVVEALKREDRIVEYVDRRTELVIEGTPRFMYTLRARAVR